MKNKILKYTLFISGVSLVFIALLLFMLNDLTRNTLLNPNKEIPAKLLENVNVQYNILKDEFIKREAYTLNINKEEYLSDKNQQLAKLSTIELIAFIQLIESILKDKSVSFAEYNLFLNEVEKYKRLILQREYNQ